MDELEIAELVRKQRHYFNSGRTRELGLRIEQLRSLKTAIHRYEKDIMHALWEDMKKPAFEAYTTEVDCVLCELNHVLKNVHSWAKPIKVPTPLIHFPASSYIYPQPRGVVLIVAPWNYPFHLLFLPLVGAIAAGNCAVLKPSEISANTSSIAAQIIEQNFDPSIVSVVEGDANVSQSLLAQKFDYIFFTGGTSIGKIVMEAAAKTLTPVTLELGGKSPCVVDEDTNIDRTARRIVWGKFLNAGQTCVAPDYLLVHESVKDRLVAKMKEYVTAFYGEDPWVSPDYARIINEKNCQRLAELMQDGNTVIGGDVDIQNLYVSPTIIQDVSVEDKIMQEEIFGPILPVIEFKDLAHAISIINTQPNPLALYFFSNNRNNQRRMRSETMSGTMCINDTISQLVSSYLPFGGVGSSGIGAYHGKASFDTFSHGKSVLKKSFIIDYNVKYPPYRKRLNMIKRLVPFMIR